MQPIIDSIKKSLSTIKTSSTFTNWYKSANAEAEDIVIVNNTFVYRQVKTNKNELYLGFKVSSKKSTRGSPVVVAGFTINSDLKLIKAKSLSKYKVMPIDHAIKSELKKLGELVYILIGQTDDTVKIAESINHRDFTEIVLDPTLTSSAKILGNEIFVRDTYDEESIWHEIVNILKSMNIYDPNDNELRIAIGKALDNLEDKAYIELHLPAKNIIIQNSVIDSIIVVLRQQRKEYAQALQQCGGKSTKNSQDFNNILRISYNFANDAITFIRLIVSICDLKPIILWATINEHFQLSEAFKDLPWQRSQHKPSLRNYRNIIADARNRAFHKLFPFRKTIEVKLPASSLKDIHLRIFSKYGGKKLGNELLYHDKELVDVLMEFTRTGEKQVTPRFWKQNLKVMDATIKLLSQTRKMLKNIRTIV